MSLAQKRSRYRYDVRRSDRLTFFLAMSAALHIALVLGGTLFMRWFGDRLMPESQALVPIEFVDVPTQSDLSTPPPQAKRVSSVNSVAGGEFRPDRPAALDAAGGAAQPVAPAVAAPPRSQPQSYQPPQPQPVDQPPQPSRPQPIEQAPPMLTADSGTLSAPEARRAAANALSGLASRNSSQGVPGQGAQGLANANRRAAGPQGVDSRRDVDLGPYMAALREKVRREWVPGQSGSSQSTVLRFVVDRSGEVSSLRVDTPSGSAAVDEAARQAIERSAPFAALPRDYQGSVIEIKFTFDLNVYGGGEITSY